jgi:hypothetical protein
MSKYAIDVPASMIEVGHRPNDSVVVTRADRTADGKYYIEVSYEYAFGQAKAFTCTLGEDNVLTYDVEVED